jgi:hypothetical protein
MRAFVVYRQVFQRVPTIESASFWKPRFCDGQHSKPVSFSGIFPPNLTEGPVPCTLRKPMQCPRRSGQSRVTMPIFSFCAVVSVALLGLIYFAEGILGSPRQLAVSTNFDGLPKPFKAGHSVEVLTVRQAPAPQASAGEQALAQAPSEVVLPPKEVALTSKSGKTKKAVKVVRTRPRSESYAHVINSNFPRMW